MSARLLLRHISTSTILFFSSYVINTAHPCLPIVLEFLRIDGIARMVAEYVEEDTVLEAKSGKYYACTFSWVSNGNLVIYDQYGYEVQKTKVNYPKAITFSPSGNSIIIMHAQRNPDSGFLFMGYLLAAVVEIKVLSLEDGNDVTYYPSRSSGWHTRTDSMDHWPYTLEYSIKKFFIDASGSLNVQLTTEIDINGETTNFLIESDFIKTSNKDLQQKRDYIKSRNEKRRSCLKRLRLNDWFNS